MILPEALNFLSRSLFKNVDLTREVCQSALMPELHYLHRIQALTFHHSQQLACSLMSWNLLL